MNYQHAEVATLDPQTMQTLCEEYIANNYIDPETSERLGVKRGLRNPDGTGVLAGLTNVCDVVGYKKDQEGHVIPIPGKLIYRGVNIEEIPPRPSWTISVRCWPSTAHCPMASWTP